MKFTPLSSACLTIGSDCRPSKIHGFPFGVPIFMVPRHKRDTSRPDWPRRTVFMAGSSGFRGVEGIADLVGDRCQLVARRQSVQRGADGGAAGVVIVGVDRIEIVA